LPDTPYRIAAGVACGAAVSMTPFLGFHFVLAALLAWALRGNILASAFGTIVGNPWTFPLIFWWTHKLGNMLMGEFGQPELPEELTFTFLLHHPWRILFPMVVGSVPTALVVWGVTFALMHVTVSGYRKARQHRLSHRRLRQEEQKSAAREAAAREIAGQTPGGSDAERDHGAAP
jgi:uncharacterized protein (DUF2062 family)